MDIHKFDVNFIQEINDRYRITICEKLKQSKPGWHLATIDLLSFQSDKKLCAVEHLKKYSKQLREEHSQLLVSYMLNHLDLYPKVPFQDGLSKR